MIDPIKVTFDFDYADHDLDFIVGEFIKGGAIVDNVLYDDNYPIVYITVKTPYLHGADLIEANLRRKLRYRGKDI